MDSHFLSARLGEALLSPRRTPEYQPRSPLSLPQQMVGDTKVAHLYRSQSVIKISWFGA